VAKSQKEVAMSIKELKSTFEIGHIIQRKKKGISIGSPYCSDLIVIDNDFRVTKSSIVSKGELFRLYQRLNCLSQKKLKKIIEAPGVFVDIKPVYTNRNGKISKEFCEKYGWPNTTIEGYLMYDNTFFKNRPDALRDARKGFRYSMKINFKQVLERFQNLSKSIKWLCNDLWEYIRLWVFFGV